MIALNKVTDAKGFANLQKSAQVASQTFRDAAASTGQFEVSQLRLNSATDDYIKKINAQKMSFRKMAKARHIANAAYKQQLALENMSISKGPSSARANKGVYDVIVPTQASAELDTARKRLGFMNAELKSGAHQMVNWGKNTQWAGRQLMVGFTMPIAAFGAAVGVMAYQVDKELTRIAKVYDTTATSGIAREKELAQVRKDSLETATISAREYGIAAKETLAVQAELAATGKTGLELQKSTLEVQRISRLGEVDQQVAIDATVALQTQFKLSNEELAESFNYMNSVENATSLATADFAAAIPIAGAAVQAFGGDVKEMGILLTAMKENGIGAVQGANAIKATMQRLGRPSKQIREEWQALTGTDITKLVDDSSNLTEIFTKINAATENLGAPARRKAFAGLFGSYQVARMMAMTKGMEDLENGVGQVSQAYKIAQQDASTWAKTAQDEMSQYQNSISGQWDIAFATMKDDLAQMGEPFVVVATQVVKGISVIAKAFNNLPDFAKWVAGATISATALAGLGLMLAGLFGNLAGNALKGFTIINGLAGKMTLVDTETKAASLSADIAAKAFLDESSAAAVLTNQIDLLTASLKEADLAQRQQVSGARIVGPATASQKKLAIGRSREENFDYAKASMADVRKDGRVVYRNPRTPITNTKGSDQPPIVDSRGRVKTFMNQEETRRETINVLHGEALKMNEADIESRRLGNQMLEDENKLRDQKNTRIKAGVSLMAIEGAAMAVMMGNQMTANNEMVNTITQGVMMAGMLAPAMAMTAPYIKRTASSMATAAKGAKAAAASSMALGGGLKGAAMGAVGMGKALMLALGPVGIITAGVTVAGALMLKAYNDQKKAREQAIKDQKTLNSLSKDFAANTSKAWQEFKSVDKQRHGMVQYEGQANDFAEARKYWDETDTGKEGVKAYDRASGGNQAQMELELFTDSQLHMQMSAQEAAENVKAFMVSAGSSYADATVRARELLNVLGEISSDNDFGYIMGEQTRDIRRNAIDITNKRFMGKDHKYDHEAAKKYIEDEAGTIIGTFTEAARRATSPEEVQEAMDRFKQTVLSGWTNVWDEVKDTDEMSNLGIESMDQLRKEFDNMDVLEKTALIKRIADELEMPLNEVTGMFSTAFTIEDTLTGAYSEISGLGDEIKDIDDLLKDPFLLSIALDDAGLDNAVEKIKQEVETTKFLSQNSPLPFGLGGDKAVASAEESATERINAINMSKGYEQSSSYARALWYYVNKVKTKTDEAASSAARLAKSLDIGQIHAGNFNPVQVMGWEKTRDTLKDSWKGIQEDIADSERDALDDRIESDKESAQNFWDGKSDALDRRQEAEQKALDNAWDAKRSRLEAYWDARIKGIEKAIEVEQKAEEARQKMFDAEISRIQRLADMANTNIDFNVALNEGDLDEAARIQNNINAEDAKFVFDREAERGGKQSEKRIDRLENRKTREEDAKDRALEAFDKQEERAKTHFQRMQKMEKDSLDKRAKMDMDSKEAGWKREKENLDNILETFLAFTPKNKKQLERHMASLGISMKDFERNTLKPMGKRWGSFIDNELKRGLKNAALEHMADNMWEQMGAKGVKQLVRALGFKTTKKYQKFINNGIVNEGGGNPTGATGITRHEGGIIGGSGKDSRKGVAKNYHGLHSSEMMVRAQKGEYVVNRRAAARNHSVLETINNGGDVMGGAGTGPMPFMSALTAGMFMKGFREQVAERLQKRRERRAAKYAYSSAPTAYSLPGVKPWALEAANYLGSKFGISTIGGVGDRSNNPYSDHPRGLALDFMTSDVDKGNALAAEALKLGPKLDATYMIWQKRIHSFDSRGWRPYSHPSGASNPTLDHMDHVHMSFSPNGVAGDLPSTQMGGKLVQGRGGSFHPTGRVGSVGSRIHGSPPAIDVGLPVGNKVYAVRDGVVSGSYDLRGHEPRAPHGGLGYRSYGRVITLNHDGGGSSLYAHLSERIAQAGQRVKAGTAIGLSGNTGYSTGPHLHFGGSPSPTAFLRKGAEYVKYDNTAATLHRGESVLTKNLTQKMHEGVDRFANGGGEQYNVNVNIIGFDGDTRALAREVAKQIKHEAARKPQSRSVGGKP